MARVRLTTKLERKDTRLPVFAVIPGKTVAAWKLAGTTVIEGTANGHTFGRRTLKAWGKGSDNWFVEFTAPFCKLSGISVGDAIALELSLADASTPTELESALSAGESLRAAWSKLTKAERREATEHVRAAKSQTTRARRAASMIEKLRGK